MGLNVPLFLTLGIPIFEDDYQNKHYKASTPERKEEPSQFKAMPMNPTVGSIWTSANGTRYIWTGEVWSQIRAQKAFYADEDKSDAIEGDVWFW